jgi:hypothetical protein
MRSNSLCFHGLQQVAGAMRFFGAVDQGAHVFGETRTAITAAGVDEVVANARVRADAQSHRFDVGAQVFGQLGDLVDEADLGRQHAVGCVLGQLGAAQVHEHDAVMVAVERCIEVTHHIAHLIAFTADDDTVRTPAIGNRRAFLQEFRVGDDLDLQQAADLDQALVDVRAQGIAGAHRNRGFLHQNHRLLAMPRDGFTHGEHVAQVRRTIVARRRADRDEQHLAVLHREFFIGGELQSLGFQAFAHEAGEARLENAHVALLQQLDFLFVDVHADHVVADFRQDRSLYQANVTATKYTDFHRSLLIGDA